MKKKLIIGLLTLTSVIFCMMLSVNAATPNVTLTANKTQVNPGDTFTVTIAASCNEGINGLEAVVTYDEAKLELVESKVADNKWLDLGQNVNTGIGISLMCNSTDTITSTNLYLLTFKVKDSITANTTSTVTVSGATLYSDASQTYNEGTKEVTISIVIPSNTDTGNNNENNNPGTTTGGDNTENGNENPGTTDNGNNNENNNPGTTTGGDNTGSGNESIATTDNESENTETKTGGNNESDSKDTTTKTDKLPKTGENDYIIIAGAVIMIIGAISFIGYRKYNQI